MTNLETLLRDCRDALSRTGWSHHYDIVKRIDAHIETINHPRLTLTAPVEQIKAVLHDWEKGRDVNGQDLINALAWRVDNQRREIERLHRRVIHLDGALKSNAVEPDRKS